MELNENYLKAKKEYNKQSMLLNKYYRPLVVQAIKNKDLEMVQVIIDTMPISVEKSLMIDMMFQFEKERIYRILI